MRPFILFITFLVIFAAFVYLTWKPIWSGFFDAEFFEKAAKVEGW